MNWLFLCGMLLLASVSMGAEPPDTQDVRVSRIGTYDSRSVAVAFAGSELFREKLDTLRAQWKAAEEAGDTERMRQLDAMGRAMQHQMHLQGFGTAPVDNILNLIADKLPELKKSANVQLLVSVWDRETLKQYPGAEQVDVTEALVDALEPDDLQRERAREIRKHEPVPLEKLQKMKSGDR